SSGAFALKLDNAVEHSQDELFDPLDASLKLRNVGSDKAKLIVDVHRAASLSNRASGGSEDLIAKPTPRLCCKLAIAFECHRPFSLSGPLPPTFVTPLRITAPS